MNIFLILQTHQKNIIPPFKFFFIKFGKNTVLSPRKAENPSREINIRHFSYNL